MAKQKETSAIEIDDENSNPNISVNGKYMNIIFVRVVEPGNDKLLGSNLVWDTVNKVQFTYSRLKASQCSSKSCAEGRQ